MDAKQIQVYVILKEEFVLLKVFAFVTFIILAMIAALKILILKSNKERSQGRVLQVLLQDSLFSGLYYF